MFSDAKNNYFGEKGGVRKQRVSEKHVLGAKNNYFGEK